MILLYCFILIDAQVLMYFQHEIPELFIYFMELHERINLHFPYCIFGMRIHRIPVRYILQLSME